MRLYALRLVVAAVVLAVLGFVGARGAGPVPPLGPLLDPANGVWSLARGAEFPARGEASIPGLRAPVQVLYDDRAVPHVFAASEEDAWRVQGYLVARDRLFQLELQTRAASGTLAELLGERAAQADLADRRRGFPWAAERTMAGLDSSALIARAARAYAAGVNAWIDQLHPAELPLEYRLLSARPARWRPIDTFYLFLQMAYTLAWDDHTLDKLAVRGLVGATAAEALFPRNSPIQEPIQPNGEGAPRYDFLRPFPPPGKPDSAALVAARQREALDLALGWSPRRAGDGDAIGSNNWVVAPQRTAAHNALLAGDPHLELSLPSVWYEIHLHVAGGVDVAGVTFPGAPGVIIGFNRDVAWSFTNTGADVRDHYQETVDEPAHPTRYLLDGAWKPLESRVEVVRGRHGEALLTDTVRFTHRGPLAREGGRWISMRWTPFEATAPGEDFLRLDRAHSVPEWLDGWKEYVAAAQNGVVADRNGSVAIRSTGKYPVRPGNGRGDELKDGSKSASDWTGFLPLEAYPFALDPPQGYLASANQQPVDPRANPHYFGVDWYSPWRALRINQLLREDSAVTPDAMRRFQTDPGSARADAFVPVLLAAAAAAEATGQGDSAVHQAAALLAVWDHSYTRENRGAVLFESVMSALVPLVWDELIPARSGADTSTRPVAVPEEAILLELVADSASAWWDDRRTPEPESRDAILAEALRLGLARTVREHGPTKGAGWRWENAHHANLFHLLRIPGLSVLDLPVQGGTSTLSPSPGRGTHGPSWRMVVELAPQVRAWGIYPGGQSGNPASARYLDRLPQWLAGRLDSVLFPARPEDLPAARVRAALTLNPTQPR
jgi:penicillin amidase